MVGWSFRESLDFSSKVDDLKLDVYAWRDTPMMDYLIEFDPQPGVTQRQVADVYKRFVEHDTKIFPKMQLEGLFARDVLLGSRPHYFALWELPDYATLDAWKQAYADDPEGAHLTLDINNMGGGVECQDCQETPLDNGVIYKH
jgi:hypothetical protein